ncbi:hypothetical protein P3G55_27135, partial [Leptospira sp. 96542]|nr:hypothetical protein [Leptospira sp. 96542]
ANWKLTGNATNLASLSVAGTSNLAGNVSTVGTQSYTGAVTLNANTMLTAKDGTDLDQISFGGTVDSAAGQNYTLALDGNVVFQGVVGGTRELGSLSVTGTSNLGGNVRTTGGQTYGGLVTLSGTGLRTLTAGSGELIDMQDGLAGGGLGLSIATANWKLAGNATNLASLSVAGTS